MSDINVFCHQCWIISVLWPMKLFHTYLNIDQKAIVPFWKINLKLTLVPQDLLGHFEWRHLVCRRWLEKNIIETECRIYASLNYPSCWFTTSPDRRQAIIWTNAGILLTGPLGTNLSAILIEIHTFSFEKIQLKMSYGKWRPFCLGLKVLIHPRVHACAVLVFFHHLVLNVCN